jgi:hypothetical protein
MHLDHPLAQRARHRAEPFQLDFAEQARSILGAPDDCVLDVSHRGLTLLARNEEALKAPRQVLQEVFGTALALDPIEVRLVPGTPPLEPIAHVRVNAPLRQLERVRLALHRRGLAVVEQDASTTRCVVRAEGRLAKTLGLGDELKGLSGGPVLLWTALARYAPCEPDPPPAA